ncbi:MAG: phosphotriesterase [Dehalococcoidia bacterium]|nr:phosphotriesterase [Dehalococcoidia bacterium]
MARARTVLGDIAPTAMGITLPHEHLLLAWGAAERDLGKRYDREKYADIICKDLGPAVTDFGVKTVVDVTPSEMGRDVVLIRDVARKLNINVICATGFYRQWAGFPYVWSVHTRDMLEEHMEQEIREGVGDTGIKCGVIKLAMSDAVLQPAEAHAFRAAATVQKKTGVAIVIHSAGWEVPEATAGPRAAVQLLVSEGADPSRIQVSHCDRAARNMGAMFELAKIGCYLAFDNVGSAGLGSNTDETRIGLISALIAGGYARQVHLSMDHSGWWLPYKPPSVVGRNKYFAQLHKEFLPKLRKAGISEEVVRNITIDNPKTLFPF